MASPHPLGIDLGTTYSAVATVTDSGRTVMVPNSEGQILTPSVVFFDEDSIIVGNAAKQHALVNIDSVAICPKRDMGKKYYSRPIRGQQLPPEVIQATILKQLKDDAVAIHGGEMAVVITVPAYFDEPRRRATAHAGEMAGLNVLDIVNEPTAAALAYGEQLGYLDEKTGAALKPLRILVYDLGGGTFDVTLLDLRPGDVKTLATDGDVKLGGRDWDEVLANYGADCFYQAHGLDPRSDNQAWLNVIQHAEQVKQALTFQQQAILEIRHSGYTQAVAVTRDTFEELTEALVERTAYTCRQMIQTAGATWETVDRIILVGGSTRMPMISKMLLELTKKPPERGVHPDEAVARGAAIYARHLLYKNSQGDGPAASSFKVTNVNAHSLGIEGLDQQTQRKQNVIIIPRNTPLPAKKVDKFVTKRENQTSIVVSVLEGESREPTHCSLIGRAVVRDLPPQLPKGWPIQVTYEYRENGRLAVHASVPGTEQSVSMELENSTGMSNARVRRWRTIFDTTKAKAFHDIEDVLDEILNEDEEEKTAGSSPSNVARKSNPNLQRAASGPANPTKPTPAGGKPAAPSARPIPVAASATASAPPPRSVKDAAREMRSTATKAASRGDQAAKRALIMTGIYVVSGLIGLLIGYYIVANVTPMGDALNLGLPGLPAPKNPGK
jgi:molecular chaperone DnaK